MVNRDPLGSSGPRRQREIDRRQPGANQYDLGSFNEATIIETIRLAGTISRTEIAQRTGLTQQSVSRILRSLLQRGLLVEEAQQRAERLGKPRTPVRLRSDAGHALGIGVDPERLSVVLADLDGRIVQRDVVDLAADLSAPALLDRIVAEVNDVLAAAAIDRDSFLGVGLAVPGPINRDGALLNLTLKKSWSNIPLRQLLAERLECPVIVEKDGTAAAIGERWVGRSARAGDFAYLYLGTGVGTGLVLNGEVYRGRTDNAGEFGQLAAVQLGRVDDDGRPQMVRECNPTVAIPEIARELGHPGLDDDYHQVCAAAGAGDGPARAAVRTVAAAIAQGAVPLVDLLDVDLVVVGGPAFEREIQPIVVTAIREAVNEFPIARQTRTVEVEVSLLEAEASALGAASTIFHNAFAPRIGRTEQYRDLG